MWPHRTSSKLSSRTTSAYRHPLTPAGRRRRARQWLVLVCRAATPPPNTLRGLNADGIRVVLRQSVALIASDLDVAPDAANGAPKNCGATTSSKTHLASTRRIP